MKAIVHIGTEKTGTTCIQQFLYLNRKKLLSEGYYFVQSPGKTNNRALPAYCIADDKFDDFFRAEGINTLQEKEEFKQSFIKKFDFELQNLPEKIHTVIISSEHFHSRLETEAEVGNVYTLLSTYFDEIKIVCYLREQAATCTSFYSTFLRAGGTESFEKFLERCKPANAYYNYQSMLENWGRAFGQESLDISLYAEEHFLNRNLLDDFTAKIDPSLIGNVNKNVKITNESLTPGGQALVRAVNLVFPRLSEMPEVAYIRNRCKELVVLKMTGKGQQPDLGSSTSIYNRFSECNEKVRQLFFPKVEKLFADPVAVEAVENVIDAEFSDALIDVVSLIKQNKTDAFMPGVYSRFWSAISTCVNDIEGIESVEGIDFHRGPSPVVFTARDAHLLGNAARTVEGKRPQMALQLMILASKIAPDVRGFHKKLKQYRNNALKTKKEKSKANFFHRFRGGKKDS